MKAKNIVILAGGLGTRLKSVVSDKPKILADINGKPFLKYLLDQFNNSTIENVYLCTGYKSDMIERYIDTVEQLYKFRIIISREDTPLGTGGAVINLIQTYNLGPFYLLNGDTLLNFDAIFDTNISPEDNYIFIKRVNNTGRYGNVIFNNDDRVIQFNEKADFNEGHISVGVYYINEDLSKIRDLPKQKNISMEYEVIPKLISSARIKVLHYDELFVDIGIPEDYELAQELVFN